MGYPAFSARPKVITLAEAPTGEPFPPRHAPSARDHHTGISVECCIIDFKSSSDGNIVCAISVTSGIMLAIKMVFSITVEAIAENHRIIIDVANMFSLIVVR